MKKLFFLVLATFSLSLVAQDKITEGIIISKQTMTSESAEVKAQLEQMGDITSKTYFKGKKSRTETSNPMTGDNIMIANGETNEVLTLMDNMMGKVYMYQKVDADDERLKGIKVVAGDKTKTILGYECKQYIMTIDQEGIKMTMDIYTTEAIPVASQQMAQLGADIKGFPLYMTITMNQMGVDVLVTTEVVEIKEEAVSEDLFSLTPPEGYKEMPGQ